MTEPISDELIEKLSNRLDYVKQTIGFNAHEANIAALIARIRQQDITLRIHDAEVDLLDERIAEKDAEIELLRDALDDLLHAVCGETGFASAVRENSKTPYPWPALDIAEAKARAILGWVKS